MYLYIVFVLLYSVCHSLAVLLGFTSVVYFDVTERSRRRSARKSERRHQLSLFMPSEEVEEEDKTKQKLRNLARLLLLA